MNTQDQELNQQLIQNPNQETVQLEQPIQFGGSWPAMQVAAYEVAHTALK